MLSQWNAHLKMKHIPPEMLTAFKQIEDHATTSDHQEDSELGLAAKKKLLAGPSPSLWARTRVHAYATRKNIQAPVGASKLMYTGGFGASSLNFGALPKRGETACHKWFRIPKLLFR